MTLAVLRGIDGDFGFAVRDTGIGIGIAAQDIEAVLSPFGQVESAFSREHHGTVLGLPLARSLIEVHGGRLSLVSELGVGTVATLWLPMERLFGQSAAPRLELTGVRCLLSVHSAARMLPTGKKIGTRRKNSCAPPRMDYIERIDAYARAAGP